MRATLLLLAVLLATAPAGARADGDRIRVLLYHPAGAGPSRSRRTRRPWTSKISRRTGAAAPSW